MKVLKFEAEYCAACKQMSQFIKDIPHTSVDIASEEGCLLSEQYQIRTLPTLVILDDKDKEVTRFTGFSKFVTFLQWLDESLEKVGYKRNF